jgi:hypothetical protein
MQIGEYFHEIEIYAYAMTNSWPEFLEIREDVLFKVMETLDSAGTRLALPAGVRYVEDHRAFATASGDSVSRT